MRFILAALSMGLTVYMLTNPVQGEPGTYLAIPAFLAPLAIGAGSALFDKFLGGGGQETVSRLDPGTQQFLEQQVRPLAGRSAGLLAGGITPEQLQFGPESFQQFLDPFQQEVIDATQADFDIASARAGLSARQEATAVGGQRGSRGAVLQAQREGQVERSRASVISGLRSQGFSEANQRALAAAGFNVERLGRASEVANFGLGPAQGQVGTSGQRNPLGTGLSAGLLAAGALGGGGGTPTGGSFQLPPTPAFNPNPDLFAGASLSRR